MKKEKHIVTTHPCKRVETKSHLGKVNGWLLELFSDKDGFTKHIKGQVYLTVAKPGVLKVYHLHAQSDYFVTCIKGTVKEIIYKSKTEKEEVHMGDGDFKTVFLPKGHPHAIQNVGKTPAYVLVYRYPAWDPKKPEQLDIAPEAIETDAAWKRIRAFIKIFK
ncbi:MAG: cupin domain-containing protein [Patescibacteria group bacterium]